MASPIPSVSGISLADLYSAAVSAVKAGMSIRQAAKRFNLKRETLRCRVRGYVPIECRRGPQLVYINEGADQGILEAIFYRASHGLSIGTSIFRDLVRQAALATCIKEVPSSFPNMKWVERWMKKHRKVIWRSWPRLVKHARGWRWHCRTRGSPRSARSLLVDEWCREPSLGWDRPALYGNEGEGCFGKLACE